MCILVDSILKKFVKDFDSYIQDSQNLMQKTKNLKFPGNSILSSFDIVDLYTSINHDECINRLTEFLRSKNFYSEHINLKGFQKILELILKNNIFIFDKKNFKQKIGIAMGSKCGPSIANVFVYTFEKLWLQIHRPLFYCRFIDDIFLISNNLESLSSLKVACGELKLTGDQNIIIFLLRFSHFS